MEIELYRFEISIGCNAKFSWSLWQQGSFGDKFKRHH